MMLAELHPNVRLRIGVGFVQRLVDSMVTAFVAVDLARRFGLGVTGGLMVAVMSLSVVGSLCGGQLAEARGRRPTLLLGEVCATADFAAMALAHAVGGRAGVMLVIAFAVNKFGAGLAMPANEAMIVDVSTPSSRRLVYTVNTWAVNLALAIGALIGGFLYGRHFTAVLVAAGTLALVAVTTALFIPETRPAAPALPTDIDRSDPGEPGRPRTAVSSDPGRHSYRQVLADRVFARFVLAATLIMTVEFQLVNWIGVRLSDGFPTQTLVAGRWQLGLDGIRMFGLLRAENTLLVVLLAFALAAPLRRVPDRIRMGVGISLFMAGYVVYAVGSDARLLLAAGLVLTIGELMDSPVRSALLAGLVPVRARSRYLAVYALHIRVALVLASLCISLGPLLSAWGMAGCSRGPGAGRGSCGGGCGGSCGGECASGADHGGFTVVAEVAHCGSR